MRAQAIAVAIGISASSSLHAAEVKAAIAANFTAPAREIAALFEKATGHTLVASFGATGQFYTQISQGAPFDVLIAADRATPLKAISAGLAVDGTAFTYATGQLALYSLDTAHPPDVATLGTGAFAKIAIANPDLAPYGAAAVETLQALGLLERLTPKLVRGSSIAQTFQFVASGNAELGFVALSDVIASGKGSYWPVPPSLHAPIGQDAVLLKAGAANDAARALLAFLKGPEAALVIKKYGYAAGG